MRVKVRVDFQEKLEKVYVYVCECMFVCIPLK